MDKYSNGFDRRDQDQESRRENDAVRREQQRKQTEQEQRPKKTTRQERPMKDESTREEGLEKEKKGSWW